MYSLGELIEFCRHQLSGLDAGKDGVSALTLSVTADDTTLPLEEMGGASTGVAEIDFEQMRVKSLSPTDGTATLWTFGRGYRGTKAVEHSVGSEVRFNPQWPASTVARELNGVLLEIYPSVYAVKSHETTVPSDRGAIDLPDEAVGVISVWRGDTIRPGQWHREDRWEYNADATTIGRGLRVGGYANAGESLRVIYAARPALFDLEGDLSQDFQTITGLDPRCSDLLTLGVARRLAPFIDVGKLPFVAAAAEANAEAKIGAGGSTARLLHSLFLSRLDQESAILNREHPIRVHRVR